VAIAGAGQSSMLLTLINGEVFCGPRMHRHKDTLVDAEEAIELLKRGERAKLRLYADNLAQVMDHFKATGKGELEHA